jgi:hypothetical protein
VVLSFAFVPNRATSASHRRRLAGGGEHPSIPVTTMVPRGLPPVISGPDPFVRWKSNPTAISTRPVPTHHRHHKKDQHHQLRRLHDDVSRKVEVLVDGVHLIYSSPVEIRMA